MMMLASSTGYTLPSKLTPSSAVRSQGLRMDEAPAAAVELGKPPAVAVELANELCPAIGFWDPLGLATADFWQKGNDFTWGWIRNAEIKHGRVAMAAFVGYCVQSTGAQYAAFELDASISRLICSASP